MNDAIQELMTPQEVAGYLKVSKNKIYQLVKQEGMPAYVIGGNLRFKREQIDIWLTDHCGRNMSSDQRCCSEQPA
jgi:excisionase family DNA binding protein